MDADPLLILIALHVASGFVAVACGAGAMLTRKGSRRHRRFGRAYVIVLVLLCGTAAILASLDWSHRWHLAVLGAVALSCAAIGYGAVRLARPARLAVHLAGMGVGYIAMLTAFYVDNGPWLPSGDCFRRCGSGSCLPRSASRSWCAPYSGWRAHLLTTPVHSTILPRRLELGGCEAAEGRKPLRAGLTGTTIELDHAAGLRSVRGSDRYLVPPMSA